jgi:hypothetical protein
VNDEEEHGVRVYIKPLDALMPITAVLTHVHDEGCPGHEIIWSRNDGAWLAASTQFPGMLIAIEDDMAEVLTDHAKDLGVW